MATVYTPEEAAAYLKVHVNTMYRLLREGEIPAARLGRGWRIAGEALDDYLYGRSRGDVIEHEPNEEDGAWLNFDGSQLGEFEPYDWGPVGPPSTTPVEYVPGKGPVVRGRKRYG